VIKDENFWRVTALPPRFLIVDARAVIAAPPLLFHARPVTLVYFIVVMGIFWLLERRGYTVPVALRMLRVLIGGLFRFPISIRRHEQNWSWRRHCRNEMPVLKDVWSKK